MRLTAFDTYMLFLALKNHFTRDSYDFFKYRGKVNATHDSFMKRSDRFQYQKLSRKLSEDTMRDFIVANIISGKTWVGDFLDDEAEDNYKKRLKITQSFSYVFGNDLDLIFRDTEPSRCFRVYKDRYPALFMLYLSGRVNIETMVVLNDMIGYIQKWDRVYADDSIWPKHSLLIRKYAPFLEYDKTKLKTVLKDKLKEYEHGEEQEARGTQVAQRANVA